MKNESVCEFLDSVLDPKELITQMSWLFSE